MSLHLMDQNMLGRTTSNVVKRTDYEHVLAAQDVLARAKDDAAKQQDQLEALRQEATLAGYAVGVEMGKQAWVQHQVEQHASRQTQLHGMQHALVDIVMSSLRHLVGELPENARFQLLAQQVVQAVVRARQLRLVVAAGDAPAARTVLERWQRQHSDILGVDVVVDSALSAGDCLLETEEGAVDGRLSQRLAMIETALLRHLGAIDPNANLSALVSNP